MPGIMRAVDVKPGGRIQGLFINSSVPKPVPAPDQCLVHVKVFGLNRGDLLQREGRYPPPPGICNIMGLEFAGIVDEVGTGEEAPGQRKWAKGDEVMGLLFGGGYAEYVVVSKDMLIEKPKELSWEVCGGLCEVWFTALQALHVVAGYSQRRVKSILWHAGASSVSIAGIQLSLAAHLYRGAEERKKVPEPPRVFATARSDEKCNMCVSQLGCTGAINTAKTPDWAAAIKELNGGDGIDLVFDFVGGPYFQSNLNVLALDGAIVNLGLLGGPIAPDPVDISGLLMKRARLEGSTLRTRSLAYQIRLRDLFVENVLPGLVDGQFEHVVDTALKWEDVAQAHEMLENNKTKGKVVCTID